MGQLYIIRAGYAEKLNLNDNLGEKMENKIKYLPMGAFVLYFLKICLQPVTLTDAAVLLILGSIASFYEFKSAGNKMIGLEARLTAQEKEFSDLKAFYSKDIDSVKSHIASIKLSTGYRTQGLK